MSVMNPDQGMYLIFRLQGSLFALDLSQVAEVADMSQMWPIPQAPPCFVGALNIHGDIVAAMDLALFLGLEGSHQAEKIIILNLAVASLACVVDSVVKIVCGGDAAFLVDPPPRNAFATATLALTGGTALLLDLDSLVRNAEIVMQKKV